MTLRAAKEINTLPPYHGAVLYALLAEVNGRASGDEPAIPDGLLLDAPEQLITRLDPEDAYAFGFTLLAPRANKRLAVAMMWRVGCDRSVESPASVVQR